MQDDQGSREAAAPRIGSRLRNVFAKDNPNYLLNLFTALLVASALTILAVAGTAIYSIYSSAMIHNAEAAAISVGRAILSAEIDHVLGEAPDGRPIISVNAADVAQLDQRMRRFLKPFGMRLVKLYDHDKRIVYSTDNGLIGTIDSANQDLDHVFKTGAPFSELEQRKDFVAAGEPHAGNASVVEAYWPIFDATHRLIGAFELHVDITETRAQIVKVMTLSLTALGVVLAVCLFSLYRPMRRGTRKLIAAHRELRDLATRDYLTGVYNRRYIADRVREEFDRLQRKTCTEHVSHDISFIMIDIDFFKKVNDTYGHKAGDLVLRDVSQRIKAGLRNYDVLGRYGGEEFLIMLPDTGEEAAATVAERLRESVANVAVEVDDKWQVWVTISLGVATSGVDQETEFKVIERADKALYEAKQGGRNRVVVSARSTAPVIRIASAG